MGAAAVGAFRARKNAARRNDDDLTVGEFLLELPSETLLDLVEAREERHRHEDHDGFLGGDIDLRFRLADCSMLRPQHRKRWSQ